MEFNSSKSSWLSKWSCGSFPGSMNFTLAGRKRRNYSFRYFS